MGSGLPYGFPVRLPGWYISFTANSAAFGSINPHSIQSDSSHLSASRSLAQGLCKASEVYRFDFLNDNRRRGWGLVSGSWFLCPGY
jgi:hypothetical protein